MFSYDSDKRRIDTHARATEHYARTWAVVRAFNNKAISDHWPVMAIFNTADDQAIVSQSHN